MKFLKAKATESATKSTSKRRPGPEAAAAGTLADDDQPQCSVAAGSSKRLQEKAKDPYRRQRTTMWRRSPKTAPPPPQPLDPPLDASNAPAAGDVQTTKLDKPTSKRGKLETAQATEVPEANVEAVVEATTSAEEVVVCVNKEQQTSRTSIPEGEGQGVILEEYIVEGPPESEATSSAAGPSRQDDEDDDDDDSDSDDSGADEARGGPPSPPLSSVPESEISARLSAEISALASLVEMSTGTPPCAASASGASSTAASSERANDAEGEGGGIRNWQRSILGRLTRARQRRDIRLNRKEVLSMQVVLEAVLKQYMNLSREVESVKANLQWETVEPVSLSRALSRLQAERREESAALAKMVACKDRELNSLQAHIGNLRSTHSALRQQVLSLEESVRERDAGLEQATNTILTQHALHKKEVEERDRQCAEEVAAVRDGLQRKLDSLKASQAAVLADVNTRHQAETAALKQALDQLQASKKLEVDELTAQHDKREAELAAALSTLRTDAAATESRFEMESMRLSRALTEKEAHLARLLSTVDALHAQNADAVKTLRADLRSARDEAAGRGERLAAVESELVAVRAENARLREDQESVMVLVSKALSTRDHDAQHLRDAMESMRKEHDRQMQAMRNAADILRSQKDVEALSFSQTINDKDIQISNLLISAEGDRAARMDAENRLRAAEEAHAGLLKTIEAMNERQEDMTRQLHHSFGQLEALEMQAANERARHADEVAGLHRAVNELQSALEDHRDSWRALQEDAATANRRRVELESLLQSRVKEVEGLHAALRDLQHGGDEAEQLRAALHDLQQSSAEETEALRRAMQELHDSHVAEAEHFRKALEDAGRKRKADADHFREALHEKDVQIRDITDQFVKFRQAQEIEIGKLETRKESLEDTVAEREREISVLKNSVSQMKSSHKDRMAELKADLAEKSEALKKHKQILEQVRAEHRDLQQRVREADRALAQVEALLARAKENDQEREEQLRDLARERDGLAVERDNLKLDVEHFTKQRENCQVVIEEKDREIQALRGKMDMLQSRAKAERWEAEQVAVKASAELERLRVERDAALEQHQALHAKVSRLFKVVRRSFDRRTAQKVALEQELQDERAKAKAQLDNVVLSHQAEQDKVMKMMLGKDNEIKQLRENLHQYEDHLRSTRDEMDATIAVLRGNIADLERDAQRKDVDLKRRNAEIARQQGLLAEAAQLQVAEQQSAQQAKERAAELERSLQDSQRRVAELELELDVGKSVLKKNTEECRLKTERLQQKSDAELAALRDTVARLQDQLDQVQAKHAAQLAEVQAQAQSAASDHQDEAERLSDLVHRLQNENEGLVAKEAELRQANEYLESTTGVRDTEILAKEEQIAVLRDEVRRMEEVLADAVRRSDDERRCMLEGAQQAVRAKDEQIEALKQEHRHASEAADRKIAALEEAVQSLKSDLDLDVLAMQSRLDDAENEKLHLSARASMLESQLEEQARRMADMAEAADKAAREKAELADENEKLLDVMQRMQREREQARESRERLHAEMQDTIRTTHGALRTKEDMMGDMREAAMDAEREAARLRQQLEAAEMELHTVKAQKKDADFLLEKAQRDLEDAAARRREAAGRDASRARGEALEEGDAGSLETQLHSREKEVEKLKQIVQALKTDLVLQKEILMTFHEGRAYLGALSDHDNLSKTARVIRDLRSTDETMFLPQESQDGDHQPVRAPRRHPLALKKILSEGDHFSLDEFDMSFSSGGLTTPTLSDLSTSLQTGDAPPPDS